ncbi:MAG: anti-sigma factor family protein [Steroidobacterales bacterium]
MPCAESLRVHAYFDGEVDAVTAVDIERHIQGCADCRALLEDLEQVRTSLRAELPYERAPAALRARLISALDGESPGGASRQGTWSRGSWSNRSFWTGAFSGVGGGAIAAGLLFFVLAPPLTGPLPDELVRAHMRSLMPAHLIDVISTDKHTVKPWFAGHADVSPVVADFEPQGFRLVGGRADYFDHQRAAVVVYQHGAHVINVFSWAAERYDLPKDTTHNGYHMVFWKSGDLAYCAVSDAGWDELRELTRLLQDLGAHDNHE